VLKAGDVVILESTSPVGTTEALRDMIAEPGPT
jgi:UDP-N-acetyl-D-mannosaminuronic acid dehydrogenase